MPNLRLMVLASVVSAVALCAVISSSCGARRAGESLETSGGGGGAAAPASAESVAAQALADPAPTPARAAAAAASAEGRIHVVVDSLLSGPVPHGDADFDALAARGVKTIISVDGSRPDLARAKARGMRYVHLPTTYSGIPRQRQAEIARAVRDLPGPVYLHCHHGKHRGPAAAASAAVLLDLLTPEEALAFMKEAGTSPSYPGLYSCVRMASPVSAAALDRASAEFPEVAPVPGFVEAMVEMELAMTHLEQISAAGWRAPADHPDLVPAAEAGRLADLLRDSRHDEYVKKKDSSEFLYFLLVNTQRAQDLERGIVAGKGKGELDASLRLVAASCKDCHVRFRNE